MQTSLPAVAPDLPTARTELAAVRSELLRQFVGLGSETLHSRELWPQTTPARAMARIARRDDDAACSMESSLGLPARNAPISINGVTATEALESFLTARSRLLSAAARIHGVTPLTPSSPAMKLLGMCRDQDRRWAHRLEWWNEEQHISFEAGPGPILIAALRAARKELLTALGALPANGRRQWRAHLLALCQGEMDLLRELRPQSAPGSGPEPGALPELPWEETWRVFHYTHHTLVMLLEGEAASEPNDPARYRQITASIDRDRAAAFAVRESLAAAPPTAAPDQPVAAAPHTPRPGREKRHVPPG